MLEFFVAEIYPRDKMSSKGVPPSELLTDLQNEALTMTGGWTWREQIHLVFVDRNGN